jgi:hypothetical protein
MSRYSLLVLLLGTGIAFAGDNPKAASSSAEPQKQAEAAEPITEQAHHAVEVTTEQSEAVQAQPGEDAKLVSVPGSKALGMSILGNQDAPKSLVIVPWKSSELANSPGVSTMLDDSRQPVDKEVFMRALRYYEIRSGVKP